MYLWNLLVPEAVDSDLLDGDDEDFRSENNIFVIHSGGTYDSCLITARLLASQSLREGERSPFSLNFSGSVR